MKFGKVLHAFMQHLANLSMYASKSHHLLTCRVHTMNSIYTDDMTFWHPFLSVNRKQDMLGGKTLG